MIIEGNQKELDAMKEFHKGNRQEGRLITEKCLRFSESGSIMGSHSIRKGMWTG